MPRVTRAAPTLDYTEHAMIVVKKKDGGEDLVAQVLEKHNSKVYVHFHNTDKRLDDWVDIALTRPWEGGDGAKANELVDIETVSQDEQQPQPRGRRGMKRKRTPVTTNGDAQSNGHANGSVDDSYSSFAKGAPGSTSDDEDAIAEHQFITRRRNFDMVNFGEWQMKTWYFSPYPVTEAESEEMAVAIANGSRPPPTPEQVELQTQTKQTKKAAGKNFHRTTLRSHGRTADMLAGGLGRDVAREDGQPNILWVCDRCFKYMTEGVPYEIHTKNCDVKNPPGAKVWERGAHTVWEIDGAVEKLYCQNLALFGKLFIDVKTLFFDTENFMFYVLTDAKPSRYSVMGFFSKEKISYDDYNLACILVLPPYQKKGFGNLLIEFSYVLSRRAGIMGTPERPLSDLGLRGYLSFWISALVRFFRLVLQVSPSDIPGIKQSEATRKRKRASKGGRQLENELDGGGDLTVNGAGLEDLDFSSLRTTHTLLNPDGSATTHVTIKCTLDDISRATCIRPEDVAFALNECGLLRYRNEPKAGADEGPGNEEGDEPAEAKEPSLVLSREMIERVAEEKGARRSLILPEHLLLVD